MKSPNIFLHYCSELDAIMTFQDILSLDVRPEILDFIQIEIQQQLNSEKLPEIFPCFNWENERFLEKWEAISKTLILQVQLPKPLWENWIKALENEFRPEEIQATEMLEFNPFDDPVFGSFELNTDVNPLLSAEVYFQKRADLDDMDEESEERREKIENGKREERREEIENGKREERSEEIENGKIEGRREEIENGKREDRREEIESGKIEERREEIENGKREGRRDEIENGKREERREESEERREESEERREKREERREESEDRREKIEERREESEDRREKIEERREESVSRNILEQLQTSPEEKFFETISLRDSSLKNLVESKMTERLSETISINQKIKFILQLFQGDSDQFNQLIDFIDQEATADNWQEFINANYQKMLNADNQDAWKELFELIQRKFN